MRNHFFIAYAGNKRNEVERIYDNIDLSGIKYIIEPFSGSFALSYYISTKQPLRFRYIINDNDHYLIEFLKMLRSFEKTETFRLLVNDTIKDINKEKYTKIIKTDNLLGWFINRKYYNIRPGTFPLGNNAFKPINSFDEYPIVNFIRTEKCKFICGDGLHLYKRYMNKNNSFIFLDPPYISACNDFYNNARCNIYEYLANEDIQSRNSTIFLCLEDMWIIRLIFRKLIKTNNNHIVYDKLYQTTKRKTNHILIKNK